MCRNNNNKCVDAIFDSLKSLRVDSFGLVCCEVHRLHVQTRRVSPGRISIGSRGKRLGNIDSVLWWTATWDTDDIRVEEICSFTDYCREWEKKATILRLCSLFSCFSSTKHQMCLLSFLRLRIYCRSLKLNRLWASHRHFVLRGNN